MATEGMLVMGGMGHLRDVNGGVRQLMTTVALCMNRLRGLAHPTVEGLPTELVVAILWWFSAYFPMCGLCPVRTKQRWAKTWTAHWDNVAVVGASAVHWRYPSINWMPDTWTLMASDSTHRRVVSKLVEMSNRLGKVFAFKIEIQSGAPSTHLKVAKKKPLQHLYYRVDAGEIYTPTSPRHHPDVTLSIYYTGTGVTFTPVPTPDDIFPYGAAETKPSCVVETMKTHRAAIVFGFVGL